METMRRTPRFEDMPERVADNNEVLLPARFFRDLALEAAHATKHVEAQAMVIENDAGGKAISEVLKHVPEGVKKTLYIDEYSRMVDGGVIYEINRHIPGLSSEAERLHEEKAALFDELRSEGVTIEFTNPPKGLLDRVFPFMGRNHVKGADVDGSIFYLGGVNFLDPEKSDFMVKFKGDVAGKLNAAFADIHAGRIQEDEKRTLNEYSDLYIDAGTPGKSIILDKAVDLIVHTAKDHIEMLSQLPPDGALAHALHAATESGVKAELITSDVPEGMPRLVGTESVMRLVKLFSRTKSLISPSGVEIKKQPFDFVHGKLLMIDDAYAYFGSHNLSQSGVDAGTQEWGIFTRDPELIKNLRTRYMDFRMLTNPHIPEVL